MKPHSKLFQQKLRKMHPNLEPSIKKELDKILAARIIFMIWHIQWIDNLVHVQRKNGDIQFCIDLYNLNRASQKDNYHVPPMEPILQRVSRS